MGRLRGSARRRGRALVALVSAAAVSLGAPACTGRSKTTTPPPPPGLVVHVHVFQFVPSPIKVKRGSTVTWVNDDDLSHTATSGRRDYAPGDTGKVTAAHPDGLFDIALDGKGKRGTFTFANPGTFHYFCRVHPGLEGDVVVTA